MRCTFIASISILSLMWGLLATSVQAQGPDNETFGTNEDDISIVKASGPVSIEITSDANLDITRPAANKRLAVVSVTSALSGRETQFALRFSPNADNPADKPDVGNLIDESTDKTIAVKLLAQTHSIKTDQDDEKWLVSSATVSGIDKTKFTANLVTSTAEPLSAGEYAINIDAAEWNE